MIEISGDECNDRKIRELKPQFIMTNEYLEAVNLNFEFTYQDNIYEKNNKIYKYNNGIFEETKMI